MFPSRLVSVLGKGALENNYSVSFDGTNDSVVVSNSSTIQDAFTGTTMTATAWIKVTGETDYPKILVKAGASGWTSPFGTFVLSLTTTSAPYNLQGWLKINTDAGVVTTDNPIALGIWYHVAMVYDGILNKLYIDGKLVDSASYTTSVPSSSYDLHIGKHQGSSEFFEGNIDNIGIWNTALSAGDIAALYQAKGTADLNDDGNSANLVGWWRMGDGVLDTYPIIADQANASLGNELWDSPASVFTSGTYNWSLAGNNTIANVSNQLQITYVDHAGGAYIYFRDSQDLSSDLTAGRTYRLTFDSKYSGGSSGVKWTFSGASGTTETSALTTDMTNYTIDFVAGGATSVFMIIGSMGTSNVVTLDNLSLKPVNGNPGLMTNMTASDIVRDTP